MLKKELESVKEQIKAKLSGFATKSFLPFALDLVDFVGRVVDKVNELESRLETLESKHKE